MTVYAGAAKKGATQSTTLVNVTKQIVRMTGTTPYTAGDAINTLDAAPAVLSIANVVEQVGGGGIIRGATLVKSTNTLTLAAFRVLLLRNTYTALEDNLIVDLSDAEARSIIAGIDFPAADGLALSLNAVWSKTNLDIPFVCEEGGTSLYLVLLAGDAYVPASAEVFDLTLLIERPS